MQKETKFSKFRLRYILLLIGFIIVPLSLYLTDPDTGVITDAGALAPLISYIIYIARIFMLIGIWHIARKMLFDYFASDIRTLLEKASAGATGAGLAIVGIGIMMLSVSIIIIGVIIS